MQDVLQVPLDIHLIIWQELELLPTLVEWTFAGWLALGPFWLELCWLEICSEVESFRRRR